MGSNSTNFCSYVNDGRICPEVIQAAYRIGDSVTNIITPMMSYFGLVMAIVLKYKKDAGVGTLISMMLPYSIVFLVRWSVFFVIWVFVLNLPVGPGIDLLSPIKSIIHIIMENIILHFQVESILNPCSHKNFSILSVRMFLCKNHNNLHNTNKYIVDYIEDCNHNVIK